MHTSCTACLALGKNNISLWLLLELLAPKRAFFSLLKRELVLWGYLVKLSWDTVALCESICLNFCLEFANLCNCFYLVIIWKGFKRLSNTRIVYHLFRGTNQTLWHIYTKWSYSCNLHEKMHVQACQSCYVSSLKFLILRRLVHGVRFVWLIFMQIMDMYVKTLKKTTKRLSL